MTLKDIQSIGDYYTFCHEQSRKIPIPFACKHCELNSLCNSPCRMKINLNDLIELIKIKAKILKNNS